MRVIAQQILKAAEVKSALLTCCLNKICMYTDRTLMSINIEITFALEHDERLILSLFNFAA
jgi:hypothetical protein